MSQTATINPAALAGQIQNVLVAGFDRVHADFTYGFDLIKITNDNLTDLGKDINMGNILQNDTVTFLESIFNLIASESTKMLNTTEQIKNLLVDGDMHTLGNVMRSLQGTYLKMITKIKDTGYEIVKILLRISPKRKRGRPPKNQPGSPTQGTNVSVTVPPIDFNPIIGPISDISMSVSRLEPYLQAILDTMVNANVSSQTFDKDLADIETQLAQIKGGITAQAPPDPGTDILKQINDAIYLQTNALNTLANQVSSGTATDSKDTSKDDKKTKKDAKKLSKTTKSLMKSMGKSAMASAGPIGALVMVIQSLGFLEPILNVLSGFIGMLSGALAPILMMVIDFLIKLMPPFQDLMDALSPIFEILAESLTPILEVVGNLFGSLIYALIPLFNLIGPLTDIFFTFFAPLDLIAGLLSLLIPIVRTVGDIFGWFSNVMILIYDPIQNLGNNITEFIAGIRESISNFNLTDLILKISNSIGNLFTGIWDAWKENIHNFGDNIATTVTSAFEDIDIGGSIKETIVGWFE